ncbi:transcriptional regulator [Candidatus Bathyarchaeota archaeon]|nr:MAG: transcriptional regulator [Candidatus Bathyarchaeota archaeon]
MVSDRVLGGFLLVVGVIVVVVYVWALFFAGPFAWWVAISLLALIAVAAVCVIIAWVGYTLITTPAPTPPSIEEAEASSEEAGEKAEG